MKQEYPRRVFETVRKQTGWECRCDVCSRIFESKRSDAVTCSATCRSKKKRANSGA